MQFLQPYFVSFCTLPNDAHPVSVHSLMIHSPYPMKGLHSDHNHMQSPRAKPSTAAFNDSSLRSAYFLCIDCKKKLYFKVLNSQKTLFKQVPENKYQTSIGILNNKQKNTQLLRAIPQQTTDTLLPDVQICINYFLHNLIHNGRISTAEYLLNLSVALRLWFCDVFGSNSGLQQFLSGSLPSAAHPMPSLMPLGAPCCKLWQNCYFNIHSD